MSLSQRFSGMVLVPWFNRAEWISIFEKIYSQEIECQLEALRILKLWKLRTPILSAGVEGSIIILEALLCPKENLNDVQIAQIYSISLLRFLNVCATNNEKQGTFYTTAVQNGLPKWLISLRHDIAHDHKLPSKCVLELGLFKCLEWLKVKYWEEQKKYISDFIKDDVNCNDEVIELLNTYSELSYNFWNNIHVDKVLKAKVLKLVHENFNKTDKNWALNKIFEKLKDVMVHVPHNAETEDLISNVVVHTCLLNQDHFEIQIETKIQIYRNLLNLLLKTGYIISIIEKLYTFSLNNFNEDKVRKIACLWIYEIFLQLTKIKNGQPSLLENEDDLVDCLEFHKVINYEKEAEKFLKKIFVQPSGYCLIFLEVLLKFIDYDSEAVQGSINLIQKYLNSSSIIENEKIHTITDLESIIDVNICITTEEIIDKNNLNKFNRWKLISDTKNFRQSPLGILPKQNPHLNPCII